METITKDTIYNLIDRLKSPEYQEEIHRTRIYNNFYLENLKENPQIQERELREKTNLDFKKWEKENDR